MYMLNGARQICSTFLIVFFMFLSEGNVAAQSSIENSATSFSFTKIATLGGSSNRATCTYPIPGTNNLVILTEHGNIFLFNLETNQIVSECVCPEAFNTSSSPMICGYYNNQVTLIIRNNVSYVYIVDLSTGKARKVATFLTDFGPDNSAIAFVRGSDLNSHTMVISGSFESINATNVVGSPKLFTEFDMSNETFSFMFDQSYSGGDNIFFKGKRFFAYFGDKQGQIDLKNVKYFDTATKIVNSVNVVKNAILGNFVSDGNSLYANASVYSQRDHDFVSSLLKYNEQTNTFEHLYYGVSKMTFCKGNFYLYTEDSIINVATGNAIYANYFIILDSNGKMQKSATAIDPFSGVPFGNMESTKDFVVFASSNLYKFVNSSSNGIHKVYNNDDFTIYPNPVNPGDVIIVKFSPEYLGGIAAIYSLDGRVLASIVISEQQITFPPLSKGIYNIVINKNQVRKLVQL